jgi:hypothetical protein
LKSRSCGPVIATGDALLLVLAASWASDGAAARASANALLPLVKMRPPRPMNPRILHELGYSLNRRAAAPMAG